ncbi:HAD family hydrolase [Rossellomorea sp. AcN35-11]|nr:HAD family hydrolase [Rossellomorea aquimaris]WJV28519.1 HAD family hydrolase [Rossellomorea sp. AcN35-11]
MIKAIMFDLDDTLLWDSKSIEEAFKVTCHYAETKVGVDPGALEQSVRENARKLYANYDTYEFTRNIGINPFEGLWGDFLDEHDEGFRLMKEIVPAYRKKAWTDGLQSLNIINEELGEELSERFRKERRERPFVYEDTFQVLNEVKGKFKLLLLTNGSPHLQRTKLDKTPELVPFFEEIIISGDIGKGKPDAAMFHHALERLNLERDEVVMVGDNLHTDILGASSLGIKTVWINRRMENSKEIVPDYEITELHEVLGVVNNMG